MLLNYDYSLFCNGLQAFSQGNIQATCSKKPINNFQFCQAIQAAS